MFQFYSTHSRGGRGLRPRRIRPRSRPRRRPRRAGRSRHDLRRRRLFHHGVDGAHRPSRGCFHRVFSTGHPRLRESRVHHAAGTERELPRRLPQHGEGGDDDGQHQGDVEAHLPQTQDADGDAQILTLPVVRQPVSLVPGGSQKSNATGVCSRNEGGVNGDISARGWFIIYTVRR